MFAKMFGLLLSLLLLSVFTAQVLFAADVSLLTNTLRQGSTATAAMGGESGCGSRGRYD